MSHSPRAAFTLVEILVVIGIILLLAALLFPVFGRVRENARQTNCASNLQQIYTAVRLYFDDEKRYPENLVVLLGQGASYDQGGAAVELGPNAPGYLRGGVGVLSCPSDTFDFDDLPRSSYGPLTYVVPQPLGPGDDTAPAVSEDPGLYVWNYWGYNPRGYAYDTPTSLLAGGTLVANNFVIPATVPTTPAELRRNPVRFSLSNRFAPPSTIITHCVHHRMQTGGNMAHPHELYEDTAASANARDLVLRLDGTVSNVDVSAWRANGLWQNQARTQ